MTAAHALERARRTPTDRQLAVLRFVAAYIREHGYPPSFVEIGAHISTRAGRPHPASTNAVADYLGALERKGLIVRHAGSSRARALRITSRGKEVLGMAPDACVMCGGGC